MTKNDKVVSFDNEMLILVDENDREIGFENKETCHNGNGILHRAFSIFVFNEKNELLMQQRSEQKRLWPLYWSNTCCSHPRKGESLEYSTHRRLMEELGMDTNLEYLFKFQYQARFEDKGSENELCSVYIGKSNKKPKINENEIVDWKYISFNALNKQLRENPAQFTPWFRMEWQRITDSFMDKILYSP